MVCFAQLIQRSASKEGGIVDLAPDGIHAMNLEISGIQKRLTRHKDRPLHQVLQLTDITGKRETA